MLPAPQFFQTPMGRTYYEGTLPNLVKTIERLAKAIENLKTSTKVEIMEAVRKALIYAITSGINPFPFGYEDVKITIARNIVSEFYHSLNRKKILSNEETENELKEAYADLADQL